MAKKTLDEMLQVGNKLRLDYGADNPNNRVIHVRGLVDDYCVYRYWIKRKAYWGYKLEAIFYLDLAYDGGHLTYIGKSRGKIDG